MVVLVWLVDTNLATFIFISIYNYIISVYLPGRQDEREGIRTEGDIELVAGAEGTGTIGREEMEDDERTVLLITSIASDTVWAFGSTVDGKGKDSIPALALATASIIEAPLSENCCVPTTETTS